MSDRADEIAREVVLRVFGLPALEKPDESYRRKDEHDYFRVCAEHELALDAVKRFAPAIRSYAAEIKAERDRLREALMPLAQAAVGFSWHRGDPEQVFLWSQSGGSNPKSITVGDARRAAAALSPTPEGGGG